VPGKDNGFLVQRKYFFTDSIEKKLAVAAGKIPAPDSTSKENVTADQDPVIRKVKADASGAVAGHVEDFHRNSGHLAGLALLEKPVADKWLDFQFKPVTPEKAGIGHHRRGIRMVGNPASVPPLHLCGIGHMIEVAVCQKKPVDLFTGKVLVGPLRRVEEDVPRRRFKEKCIGIERTAGKRFELIHD